MFHIHTLNNIAAKGLDRLPRDQYAVSAACDRPDAYLVRSQPMHAMDIPGSVLGIGRAGAGVNNIPVTAMSERGIPVFNAPGANANAVKELVIASILLAARNLPAANAYVRGLDGTDEELARAVESGKKKFIGFELPQRTLGAIGLGAIGVEVANAALNLGMQVVGFDTVARIQAIDGILSARVLPIIES